MSATTVQNGLSVCFYIYVICTTVVGSQETCSFPNYLVVRPRWETGITLERRAVGAYWMFSATSVNFTDLTGSDYTPTVFHCDEKFTSDTFLLRKNPGAEDVSESYMCVQFVERSPNIVTMRYSVTSNVRSTDLCDVENLQTDNYPLVWPLIPQQQNQQIQCALNGGYSFYLANTTSLELCRNSFLAPLWESDCNAGEGITVDFRLFTCRGKLGMDMTQQLFCLGDWIENGYTYTIVTDKDSLWPKLWMLRLPEDLTGKNINGYIQADIVAVPEGPVQLSGVFYEIHFTQNSYPSICQDEGRGCDVEMCTGDLEVYCQRFCEVCEPLAYQSPCSFANESLGIWSEVSQIDGEVQVNITTSSMSIGTRASLQCFQLHADMWYPTTDRRATATVFPSGCRPRFVCAQFVRASPSVLQYRLGQTVFWPHSLPLFADDICADSLFADEKLKVGDLHPHNYKTLVARPGIASSPVPCGLSGHWNLEATYSVGGNSTANIDSCSGNPTQFQYSDDAGSSIHRCLASFTDTNGDTVIVTETSQELENATADAFCWTFHQNAWDPKPRLYLTYASDCQVDLGLDVTYRGYTGYIAWFKIVYGPGNLGGYPCSDGLPAPATDVQPGKTNPVDFTSSPLDKIRATTMFESSESSETTTNILTTTAAKQESKSEALSLQESGGVIPVKATVAGNQVTSGHSSASSKKTSAVFTTEIRGETTRGTQGFQKSEVPTVQPSKPDQPNPKSKTGSSANNVENEVLPIEGEVVSAGTYIFPTTLTLTLCVGLLLIGHFL